MNTIFSCTRCGFCCQGETTVSLDENDQRKMLEVLNISREEALHKYWRVRQNEVQMKTIDGHCVFYENGCKVHKGRPARCREWPLVNAICIDKINLETIRSSCPGLNRSVSYARICNVIGKNETSPLLVRESGRV